MLSHKTVELKATLNAKISVSIFSLDLLCNHDDFISQRWIWPFSSFRNQDINKIMERKRERSGKKGVKAIILAAPRSSGKQRTCFNIWWVSGLRPGNHKIWSKSVIKYLFHHVLSEDLTMLGPFLPCMQKCCVMFPTRNCLVWNMSNNI